MPLARGFNRCFGSAHQCLVKSGRIKRFSADVAVDQVKLNDFIPLILQKMLEQDRFLGTDPPACATAGAQGHIVKQDSFAPLFFGHEGIGRAILYAGQTAVALIGHLKVGHGRFSDFMGGPVSLLSGGPVFSWPVYAVFGPIVRFADTRAAAFLVWLACMR